MRIHLTILFFVVFHTYARAQDPASNTQGPVTGFAGDSQSTAPPSTDDRREIGPSDPAIAELGTRAYSAEMENTSPMRTPPPVNIFGQSTLFAEEITPGNYFSGEVGFSTWYEDYILRGPSNTDTVSDVIYSVRPALSWNTSTSRLQWKSFYAPRFIVDQRDSQLDRTEHELQLQMAYRLAPHVTFAFQDSFSKTASQLSSFEQNAISPLGIESPVPTVLSPLADRFTNNGSAEIAYQFSANAMLGASGDFSQLHYLDSPEAVGFFDSTARIGQAFYSHRISDRQYVGARYEYQYLLSSPVGIGSDVQTQTHSTVLFYTLYLNPRMSISVFAGPQHANSSSAGFVPFDSWYPTYSGKFSWEGKLNSLSFSAGQSIEAGGGLQGAVRSVSGRVSFRRQLTKATNVELSGYYSDNAVLETAPQFDNSGHSAGGLVTLQRQLRENLVLELGYARLQENYSNITTFIQQPRNRVSLSLAYRFTRPVGQ